MEYINIHTHNKKETGKFILNLFPSDPDIELPGSLFSIGIHPWYITNNDEKRKMKVVRELAQHSSCVAIGETGLDRLSKVDFEEQIAVFRQHIEIAEEVEKPLILHCVKAFNEVIKLKRTTGSQVPWIVHGFNANLHFAQQLISEGFFMSFGKAFIYSGSNAQKALAIVPDDGFFLETDDSELSIHDVYAYAARCRNNSLEEIATIIEMNFNKTFKL
jgi:TatD DNase family protein